MDRADVPARDLWHDWMSGRSATRGCEPASPLPGASARPPSPKELMVLGDPFIPYRSAVAWYCWRVLDIQWPD